MNLRRHGLFGCWMPLIAIGLAGCALAPPGAENRLEAPVAWDTQTAANEETQDLSAETFWAGFGSSQLQELQQQARAANPDMMIAAEHLQLADDAVRAAQAQQQPSLSFNAGSVDTAAAGVGDSHARHRAGFELALNASYELDFWGRLRSQTANAQAEAEANALDAGTLRIGLMSLVAHVYFDLAQAEDAANIEQRRLALAQERLTLQNARLSAGRIDGQQMSELRDEVNDIRLRLDDLHRQRRSGEWQLALLVGRLPQGYALKTGRLRAQIQVPPVPAGLPSTLLQRRPDLLAAEARVSAAQARIGVARAEQFPQIRLTAQLGVATDLLHQAGSSAFGLFGLGPEVSFPIYDGGARAAGVDASRHEALIAQLEYRKAALAAFADVENALQQRVATQAKIAQARDRADREAQSGEAVLAQLAAGRKSRLDVIAAQERQLDAETVELESYRAHLDSLLGLFQALGGGWRDDYSKLPA